MDAASLPRNDETDPATVTGVANELAPAEEKGQPLVNEKPAGDNEQSSANGHAAGNGSVSEEKEATRNGTHSKREKRRMTRPSPSSRMAAAAEKPEAQPRPVLAVFCWESPDSVVGQTVAQTVAALAQRRTDVHLFARFPFALNQPHIHDHAVGEMEGDSLFARVQEFTSRAANAFMHQFPGGSPHVTLMGYEWSGAGPLGLLRGLKNNRSIFSITSVERQRSDMTAEISKRINELECATLRETQVVLCQQQAAADVARFWVPECAPRLVAARQPFPIAAFNNKVDPGEVKARYQVGPVDPTILFVGDFSDRYGPDLLVKAMPAVLRNHPQARLILVGDGATYWTLRVYSRYLLLDNAIRFPGSVVGPAMHELVEAADIVAVPSRESTPWWPIQAAWAAQRPLVATHQAAPGLLEHEHDSLLVYPVEQSLVWGIERILYDADLGVALAKKGRAKLEERFGWNTVAEQIEELMGITIRG